MEEKELKISDNQNIVITDKLKTASELLKKGFELNQSIYIPDSGRIFFILVKKVNKN